MKQKSRFCTARRILLFWTLFIGLGAVAGALAMLLDPQRKEHGHGRYAALLSGAALRGCGFFRTSPFPAGRC